MNEEVAKKLFNAEASFSKDGTNNEKGTGIGLLLCKDFIEKHNGTIHVENEINKGSTFHITFPI